jgi:hypothetical protein
VTIGSFSVAANARRRSIRYHFVDHQGEHRGGVFASMVGDGADDMTIIFYDEQDPDRSIPALGLMFHKLVWSERRASREEEAAKAAKGGTNL